MAGFILPKVVFKYNLKTGNEYINRCITAILVKKLFKKQKVTFKNIHSF